MARIRKEKLRDLLIFQDRTTVDDGYGNPESGPFTEVFRCRALLIEKMGTEAVMAARLQGTQTYLIRVRDFEDTQAVRTDWRAVDARDPSRIFNIRTNVSLVDSPGWREMTVQEGVAT